MPTVEDILKTAIGEVGITEYPPNSNNVKYNTAFYGKEVSGSAYPWCCAFVWWVFAQHDPCLVKKTASCQDLGNWFNSQGRWFSDPQIGDIVFFHFNTNDRWTNHVGIVKDIKGNMIETIEGNTSVSSDDNGGAVMVRQRTSNIVGYGRPDYAAVADTPSGYRFGVDVSEYQGVIDFDKLKESDISFLCSRSTKKNGLVDAQFERNIAECIARRIDYSCYKYCYATTHDQARREADSVINLLQGIKMPIWYDMEDKSLVPFGNDAIEGIALSFIGECKEAGFEVGIYCNLNWYNNYINPYLKERYPFWIARYGKNTGKLDEKYKPSGHNVIAWQYTSKGSIPGIVGNVDLDVLL
ncbi:MAG: CHAP domain-containing protein [Clostridiales bacterium]|nr:CHAP domain-containing protein [Clostridiales bacterium]